MQDPLDFPLHWYLSRRDFGGWASTPVDGAAIEPLVSSLGQAGERYDAVEEVGDVAKTLVGSQVMDCCGEVLFGTGGADGGVDIEEGIPLGDGSVDVPHTQVDFSDTGASEDRRESFFSSAQA
ncbi:hypothetical protein [Streptomyces sp. NRRL F-2664]|uniref:hypothetical protein n=1 Tax=Streptomyces sp. NRRL F-2664 TaxID=1463842 RepID=UPI00131DCD22|nr:hypothetical protein [Streptomyces sp. NRRL F-2664]